MNEKKLEQLFAVARQESAPVPPPEFAAAVWRAVRREPRLRPESSSLFDQLNSLFPRLALAAMVLIVLCAAADFGLTAAGLPDVGDGVAQAATQFVFNAEDL
jgi:hypothetical protein